MVMLYLQRSAGAGADRVRQIHQRKCPGEVRGERRGFSKTLHHSPDPLEDQILGDRDRTTADAPLWYAGRMTNEHRAAIRLTQYARGGG
jgi:hypothetical protein